MDSTTTTTTTQPPLPRVSAQESTPDMFYTEQLPPSYEEEREACFNHVVGMNKVQPLVDLPYDPVTHAWCEQSHNNVVHMVSRAAASPQLAMRVHASLAYRWFDLELASTRGVCVDRYHMTESFSVPLWVAPLPDTVDATERNDANRNIPALLLRRILRAEIAQENPLKQQQQQEQQQEQQEKENPSPSEGVYHTPLILNQYLDLCAMQEVNWFDNNNNNNDDDDDDDTADCVARQRTAQVDDLHYLLAPFTETMRFLFPLSASATDLERGRTALKRVLFAKTDHGPMCHVFEVWKIPPPTHDARLMALLANYPTPEALEQLERDYQMYCTVLWRLVKAHRLMLALTHVSQRADRSDVFHVAYSYSVVKCIEHRAQLFIDTHIDIYAWALADGVWTDADWLVGPGGQTLLEQWIASHPDLAKDPATRFPPSIDVGQHSPIVLFYPHCRNVHPCEGELPDASSAIGLGNLTRDINVKPSNPTLEQAFRHLFACKLMSHRCLVRNFTDIILRYLHGREPKDGKPPFVGFASLKEFVVLVMRCGLLGNWKFATCRPSFAQRIAIEYAFMPLIVPSRRGDHMSLDEMEALGDRARFDEAMDEDGVGEHPSRIKYRRLVNWDQSDSISRWITENASLCFYIMKEHYAYVFQSRRSLDIVMSRYGQWGRYKSLTMARMDHVRYMLDTEGGFDMVTPHQDWMAPLDPSPEHYQRHRNIMRTLETCFAKFHRADKKCFIKLLKGPWLRVWIKHMNSAITLAQMKDLPSGYQRVAMPGDDNTEAFSKNGCRLTSTADALTAEEIRIGEERRRTKGSRGRGARTAAGSKVRGGGGKRGRGARSGGARSGGGGGGDDDDDDDEDEDDEDDEEYDDDEDDNDPQDDDYDSLMDLHGLEGLNHANGVADLDDPYNTLPDESASRDAAVQQRRHHGASAAAPPADTYASDHNLASLAKQMKAAAAMVQDVDLVLMDMVTRDVMRRRQSTWFMETRWLVELFGVAPENAARLRAVYAYYENYEMPDHQLLERAFAILKRSPRCFYVIRLYCYMLVWHSNQIFIPLPLDVRHRQLVALRNRWEIPEQQDMPQDIGWCYFCPGSRRWFSAEAGAPKHKIDTARDRQRYLRDMNLDQGKDTTNLRLVKAHIAVKHQEKESELTYSINMEHATYNDMTRLLYARRKTDPTVRRLQAVANLITRPESLTHARENVAHLNEQDLMDQFGAEIQAALAEVSDHMQKPLLVEEMMEEEGGTTPSAAVAPGKNFDVTTNIGDDDDDAMDIDAPSAATTTTTGLGDSPEAHLVKKLRARTLMSNEYITIVVTTDEQGARRQYGFLSEASRREYRRSPAAVQSLYDSGFRSPLIPIDMVGRIVIMNERGYVLCAVCGILTPFEGGNMTNEGCTCGLHDLNALHKPNRKFLMLNTKALPASPTDSVRQLFGRVSSAVATAAETTTLEMEKEEKEEREDDVIMEDANETDASGCIFCKHQGAMTGALAHQLKDYTLMRRKDAHLMHVKICARDERLSWGALQILEAGGYPDYDKVYASVEKNRLRVVMGLKSGEKMIPGRSTAVFEPHA